MARERIAFVTGAAQGLGFAMAKALYADGCAVILTDVQEDRVADAARSLDPSGERAMALRLDVSDHSEFLTAADTATKRFGKVDILVNNAGMTVAEPFFDISPEKWDRVMAVNLRSVFWGCQIFGRQMRDNGWGRIINLSSRAGQVGSPIGGAHYSVSKAGILCLTKVVARELAAHGVTANAIAPAVIRAPVMAELPQAKLQQIIDEIPVGRIGEADEVGALAAFLASEEAGYITGATFDINGGQLMR